MQHSGGGRTSRNSAGAAERTEREIYAFHSLKGTFGHSWSLGKTTWTVARVFTTLGLGCDTEQQAWLVHEEKRVAHREIARDLTAQLEHGEPDLWTLGRFAGKTAYHQRACGNLRRHQNVQHAVLTGRDSHGEVPEPHRRWWEVQRAQQRKLTKELREMLSNEIKTCVDLVAAGRVHPFVREEHVALQAVRRGGVVLHTDAILDRHGFVLRDAGERTGDCRGVISGGITPGDGWARAQPGDHRAAPGAVGPVHQCSDRLARGQPRGLQDPGDWSRAGRAHGGEAEACAPGVGPRGTMGLDPDAPRVPSAENPADEPSRLKHGGEIRLKPEIFDVSGPRDVDGVASQANRVVGGFGRKKDSNGSGH